MSVNCVPHTVLAPDNDGLLPLLLLMMEAALDAVEHSMGCKRQAASVNMAAATPTRSRGNKTAIFILFNDGRSAMSDCECFNLLPV